MPNVEAVVCNIKFIDRPTCSCGLKMESVEYEGYYDSFNIVCGRSHRPQAFCVAKW